MNILIIAPDYPDKDRSVYTFVKQVVDQFAIQGNRCCVIAPYSISQNHKTYSFKEVQKTEGGENVIVLRPNHFSLSTFTILGFTPSDYWRKNAINKALKQLPFVPDVVYAHFWRSGREIYPYAKKNGIPLFVATGESQIPTSDVDPKYIGFYNYVSGVICVSTKNLEESVNNGMTTKEKCIVLPNAINNNIFNLQNKELCRKKLNIPLKSFIVAFCGAFIHRKGVAVLSAAIDSIKEEDVYSLFMGRSLGEEPSCRNILFKGPVPHNELSTYLNASDIFVLPTLNEGCCNAIIEAMACGLPIVSSDKPFNWDVLDSSNSILINPEDSGQVAAAIVRLRDDKDFRKVLSQGSLKMAGMLTIERRASKILEFIKNKIK